MLCLPLTLVLGPPLNLMGAMEATAPLLVAIALLALILSERGEKMGALLVVHHAEGVSGRVSLVRPVPVNGQEVTLLGEGGAGPPRGEVAAHAPRAVAAQGQGAGGGACACTARGG